MSLPAYALITLGELKAYIPKAGTAQDVFLERMIARASAAIEAEGVGGRRLVYRGPVESYASVVNAQAIVANGNLALVGWAGNTAGRTLVVQKTDADRGLTSGTLTVTGTDVDGEAQTEAFDLTAGDELHGVKFFATITQAACVAVGVNSGDTLSLGLSPGYTELYSPCGSIIRPLEWPVRHVVEVHENFDRVFDADHLLVEGTDYEVRNAGGIQRAIARLSSGLDASWISGTRVVQGRLSAGYRTSAEVPEAIKGVCLELAAWYATRVEDKQYGLTSQSDGHGTRSFSGPPMLTQGMKNELAAFWRAEVTPTAERAFVDEAA